MMHRAVLLAAAVLAGGPALAQQTDNHGIHAVPAPGRVTIDGKLDDWDLSGQILICYDLDALRDIYSAQVAMMYDADALYVSLHWKDPTPMGNSHHPRYQSAKGWAGDSVQLRFKTDRIAHVTAWYYAAGKEPTIQISYGKDLNDPFHGGELQCFQTEGWKLTEGAEMAFLKDADGRGYVQEIKLPWHLIATRPPLTPPHAGGQGGGAPQAGGQGGGLRGQFACGIELLWGEADWPVHRYADNLAEGATSREFFWTAHNAWGPVWLEAKGHLKLPVPAYMKALQGEAPAGPVAISYTLPKEARVTLAIDDAAGSRVRNLIAAQRRPKGKNTERWDGLDDNGRPVPPGRYRFRALYHDGIHTSYVMSFANPGNPSWQTPDGRGAFYGDHTPARAAAGGGEYVALACVIGEAGQHLIGCDLQGHRLWGLADRAFGQNRSIALATDGKTLWVANETPEHAYIYRAEMATGKYVPWKATARDSEGKEYQVLELEVGAAAETVNLRDIALRNGVLAVCLAADNKVKLLDAETGAVKVEIPVEEPRAAAFDTDGTLIILSKDRLLRASADGKSTLFAQGSFPDAYGLVVDAQRRVYLTVRGADQNVKVFSADGKPAGEIGRRGGRPANGRFDAGGMRNPGFPAIDSQGRLWVPEEADNPKRTSVWSADGKLLADFIGTTHYAGAGAINPDDPTMAFSDNTVYRIDLEKGTWQPVYSLGRRDDPADLFPPRVDSRVRILTLNGATYVYSSDRTGVVRCLMGKNGEWRMVAAVGVVPQKNDSEAGINFEHPLLQARVGQSFAWADRNGDGLVQADELSFGTGTLKDRPFVHYYWGTLPGTDGTISYVAPDHKALLKLPIRGFTPAGAPIYDVASPQVVALNPEPKEMGGEGHIMGGSQGRVYLNQSPLMGVAKDGKVLFTYPSNHVSVHGSHTAKASRPGYLIGPSSILGTADFGGDIGEVFDMNGNLGENYLFTADGLWVQALFKDTRGWFETPAQAARGMSMDTTTAGGESFGGNFVRTGDGKVYLTIGGTDARVLQVTGLDTIRRFAGTFDYTPKQHAEALRLAQEQAAKANEPKVASIARAAAPPTLDGKAQEWPELTDESKPAILIQESPQRRYARVAARYDDQNLYVAWRVFGPGSMRNAGQDDRLLFKTGDVVDLMLGGRSAGDAGIRVLLTKLAGQPAAVLYEKKVPGTPARDRVPFSSPWRGITFDRVVRTDEVKLGMGGIGGGYFVEAAIPWKLLRVAPKPGLKLKGDFGVLFADSGGTMTVSRQYWSNKATGLVNDVPGEADLTPALWGELTLE